jgi:hypothetical protein
LVNLPILIRPTEPNPVFNLESAERVGEEPSRERQDALIGMAAHGIKNLSKTDVKIDEV